MKPSILALFLLTLPLAAQLPEDVHWFYDYDGPSPEPFVMTRVGNHLYTGGLFLTTTGVSNGKNLVRFNLQTEGWEEIPGIGSPLNGSVRSIYAADGFVYIGGNLSSPGGTDANRVARFNPDTGVWGALEDDDTALSSGDDFGPSNGEVRAITKSGDYLYVGGSFSSSSWPVNERIIRRYRFSTQTWEPVGAGLAEASPSGLLEVRALVTMPDGSVLAGGSFPGGLARWDGSSWSNYGGGVNGDGVVRAIALHPDGRVFVGGSLDQAGSGGKLISASFVAAYSPGTDTWNNLAGGFDGKYIQSNGTEFNADGIYDIVIAPNGVVYVAGDFQANPGRTETNLDHVAVWDDTGAWKPLGSGVGNTGSQIVNCLEIGQFGDLYVGGTFSEGWRNASSANTQVARWRADFDFTGYVPGASQNTTVSIESEPGGLSIGLHTRLSTDYVLESAPDLEFTTPTTEASFRGNGSRIEENVSPSGPTQFYRFRATDF